MLHSKTQSKGFTVVELLVVIAIIVALTVMLVFAFGNWRQRTAETEVKTALTSLAAALKNHLNFNNTYPSTVPATYVSSDGVSISYTGSGTTYCASGTSTAYSTIVWYVSSGNQIPSKTAC